jgi:hypothetical protein
VVTDICAENDRLRAEIERVKAERDVAKRSVELQAEHINDLATERNALKQAVADAEVALSNPQNTVEAFAQRAALDRFRNRKGGAA